MDREDVWRAIDDQRRQLVDLLEDLSDEEWDHPSLCERWDRPTGGSPRRPAERNLGRAATSA
jgi:hypothetical protein